jgi:3-oxoacyl-[acyl-carrier-protein] synthase II
VDALSPFVIAGFNSLRLLSKKECRPFSADRDGLNPGEGAACILLEEKDSAIKRNAFPLAKITGYGTALEAYHYTKSHPEGMGVALAIRKALKKANVNPDQIDHIHAHGTATVFNDLSEYNGFYNVFGDKLSGIPVCSTKSMTGHTFAAAGIIAVVLTVLSIENHCIPATLFCEHKDQMFDKLVTYDKPTEREIKRALVVAIGFGGEVAALVVENV